MMSWQMILLGLSTAANVLLSALLIRLVKDRREALRENRHLREMLRRKEWQQ